MKRLTRLHPSQGGRFASPVVGIYVTSVRTGDVRQRCFICGAATVNERRFAVCSDCDDAHGIREKWAEAYGKIEARHEREEGRECFCPGWIWMNEDDDASFNIERCDTCRVFRCDIEAASAMAYCCRIAGIVWC